jgi:hypothetical protein
VGFRLTDAELSTAKTRAESVGLSLGAWFRRVALEKSPVAVPAINREAWAKLGKLAGNLNQLTAAVNAGRVSKIKAKELDELRGQVMALRSELRGEKADDSQDKPRRGLFRRG